MVKEKKSSHKKKAPKYSIFLYFLLGGIIAGVILVSYFVYSFENRYTNKIYPGVTIDNISFGGMTPNYVEDYFNSKSQPLRNISITLSYEDKIATISGENLNIAFDGKLSSVQAYSIGRSPHILSNLYQKVQAKTNGINL